MIVRADRGGIAAQSWEIARHCRPQRVLVVDLGGGGRGPSDPSLYDFVPERRVCEGYPSTDDIVWLCAGMVCVFSVEGIYGEASREAFSHTGTRVVLQANPELYVPADLAGVNLHVVAPTDWRLDVLPDGTEVLPVPVDTVALCPEARQDGPLRLGHMAGAAMLDRNGTLVLLRALRLAPDLDCEVLYANHHVTPRTVKDKRMRNWLDVPTYLERWSQPRPDVLVQPRRYGGLCLPAQEAAACGIPTIMPNVAPQSSWPLPLIDAEPGRTFPMKGGQFHVAEPSPEALRDWFHMISAFWDRDLGCLPSWSDAARAWAESLSWERWRDRYWSVLLG